MNEAAGRISETKTMDYTSLRRAVYRCREQFPFAEYTALARSWNGRALFLLKLGNQADPVLFLGGFDGTDRHSPRLLLRFFEKLCRSFEAGGRLSGIRIRSVLQEKGVMILPCVNPDGLALGQTVNAHGVNLSENYKPFWEQRKRLTLPSDDALFAGKTPECEPETRAVLRACRRYPFRYMIVMGPGQNAVTAYAPDCPEQKAEMMQKVLCAAGGFEARPPRATPGAYCGAAEQFEAEFRRPAFWFGLKEAGPEAEKRWEEALVLACLM